MRRASPPRGAAEGQAADLAVTGVDRTLVDLALTTDRATAVSAAESAMRTGHLLGDLRAIARGRHGAAQISAWWPLADVRAATPLETRTRLPLVDAGLAPDEPQYPAVIDGEVIAVLDMSCIVRRVAVEADGREPHMARQQFNHDRRRLVRLQEAGDRGPLHLG